MKGANSASQQELAGLTNDTIASAQIGVPATHFAGVAKLKVFWIMQPVDITSKKANNGKKAGLTKAELGPSAGEASVATYKYH